MSHTFSVSMPTQTKLSNCIAGEKKLFSFDSILLAYTFGIKYKDIIYRLNIILQIWFLTQNDGFIKEKAANGLRIDYQW